MAFTTQLHTDTQSDPLEQYMNEVLNAAERLCVLDTGVVFLADCGTSGQILVGERG